MIQNWVRTPRPKRDLEIQTTSTALKLGSEDSTLSGAYTLQVGHDPCPGGRELAAAVTCCVRKARSFRYPGRLWNRTREARALRGFQHHKRENHLFCFLFSDPITVGLKCCTYETDACVPDDVSTSRARASRAIVSGGAFLFLVSILSFMPCGTWGVWYRRLRFVQTTNFFLYKIYNTECKP